MVLVHRHIFLIEQLIISLFLEKHHFLPLKLVDRLLPAMPCMVTTTGHFFRDLAKLSKGINNRVISEIGQKNVV
jgi:hypothetical protein